MREDGILLGGEQSGHIILPGESMGDGILTALVMTKIYSETLARKQSEDQLILGYEAIQKAKAEEKEGVKSESTSSTDSSDVTLKSICSMLKKLPQTIKNQPVSHALKQAFRTNAEVAEEFIRQQTKELEKLNWSLNIRASGTEELVRVTIWGDNPEKIRVKADEIAKQLKSLEDLI